MKAGIYFCFLIVAGLSACHNQPPQAAEETVQSEEARTPVTVVAVETGTLSDSIVLNATSVFLLSSYVRSTANGYVKAVNIKPGQLVHTGDRLFSVETKESTVIGSSISSLDSSFKFTGISGIRSNTTGYITQLNHQQGDYVQDGEQLAVISDINSFAFVLNLPYELRPYVLNKRSVDLLLPDGTRLAGAIGQVMPTVDSLSQTQQVVIRVHSRQEIPQNLVAKVTVLKEAKQKAQSLPRSAILSDETQTSFWVMKMIDSATAVRQPIRKGVELHDRVEIIEPLFGPKDLILVSGNYGLADTAKVLIGKP